MTMKRSYEATQIGKDHPAYIDGIKIIEIHAWNEKDEHWLFYIAPKAEDDIFNILEMIDSFEDEVLDMLTLIWTKATLPQ